MLEEAETNLRALQGERERVCKDLENEAKAFLNSGCTTPERIKRFHTIYNLLRFQIHNHLHHMYSLLQAKLSAMSLVQEVVGTTLEDGDVRALTITVTKGRITDATIRLMERGLEAMRVLNSNSEASSSGGGASMVPGGGGSAAKGSSPYTQEDIADDTKNGKNAKRTRLPAAAVKDMRTWLHEHWHNPAPSDEEKMAFARKHNIKVKQVENWFINTRMRVWRPAMRRALEHAEETGSYSEFSKLLKHTEEGNVYKKFLEGREKKDDVVGSVGVAPIGRVPTLLNSKRKRHHLL
ncbi:unnamed protein product [Choristocarpus tenellus]